MQSCQSFYAICNRISLRRRRAGARFCLRGPPFPSSSPIPRRLPIDSTCLRLRSALSLSPFSFFFSYLACTFICALCLVLFFRVSLPFPLAFSPHREEKCPEIFSSPFLSLAPTVSRFWYRQISVSQYSACAIVFSRNSCDKARGLWRKFLCPGIQDTLIF